MHIRIKSHQIAERRIGRASKTNACISAIRIGSRARGAVSGLKFLALACGPRGTLRRAAQREGVDFSISHRLGKHIYEMSMCIPLWWTLLSRSGSYLSMWP